MEGIFCTLLRSPYHGDHDSQLFFLIIYIQHRPDEVLVIVIYGDSAMWIWDHDSFFDKGCIDRIIYFCFGYCHQLASGRIYIKIYLDLQPMVSHRFHHHFGTIFFSHKL